MIRVEGVGVDAPGADGRASPILRDVSFELDSAGLCLVSGPTGSGKSTLLHVLAGVLRPTRGVVWLGDRPISRFSALHRDLARRGIGLLPQRLHLLEWLDVKGNVVLPLVARGRSSAQAAERILDQLRIASLASRPTGALSGGERQRVALARALVAEPPVLVLDEPTAHQDDEHAARVLEAVGTARREGATVVVASHDSRVEHWAASEPPPCLHIALEDGRALPRAHAQRDDREREAPRETP